MTGGNKSQKNDKEEPSLIATQVSGEDSKLWRAQKPRFIGRLYNTFISFLDKNISTETTANDEINDVIDSAAEGINEKLKGPKLINEERQANINKLLAEKRQADAATRKLSLEGDKLELEINRQKVHASQKAINDLIQEGKLEILMIDGILTIKCDE